jgi:hypothetical protein
MDNAVVAAIAKAGAIPLLVKVLRDGLVSAAGALLCNLTGSNVNSHSSVFLMICMGAGDHSPLPPIMAFFCH